MAVGIRLRVAAAGIHRYVVSAFRSDRATIAYIGISGVNPSCTYVHVGVDVGEMHCLVFIRIVESSGYTRDSHLVSFVGFSGLWVLQTRTKIDISPSANTGNADAFSSLNALDAFALAGKVQAASSSVTQKHQETDDLFSEKKSLPREDGAVDSSRLDSFGFDSTLSAPWGPGGSTASSPQNLPPAGGNASFGLSTSSGTSDKAPVTEELLLI